MAKPYDSVTHFLLDFDPLSWARWLGYDTEAAELYNADLSTVTSLADAIILLGKQRDTAAHVEAQASYDAEIGLRLVIYYALGFRSGERPMESVLVLLRKEADGPAVTGVVRHTRPDGSPILEFHYRVVRVWELSAEDLFNAGIGVMPLAFIANVESDKLPGLIRRAAERLNKEVPQGRIGEFWTSIGTLMGLKYKREMIAELMKGVRGMKESTFYQGILEEGIAIGEERGVAQGEARGKRDSLLRIGTKRFGAPNARTRRAIDAISSSSMLDDLIERSLMVSTWAELLQK